MAWNAPLPCERKETMPPRKTSVFGSMITRPGLCALLTLLPTCANGAIPPRTAGMNVWTYRNDNARTGQNLKETLLTPGSVKSDLFGKLASLPVDGYVYAQPLYLSGIHIPNKGVRNVVYVATEHDSVYAFDADVSVGVTAVPLWRVSFLDPAHRITTLESGDVNTNDIVPEIGITGTPVIDTASGTLYVVSKTKQQTDHGPVFSQKLHALDVATGAEKFGGPVEIKAVVPGTGDGSENGKIAFNPLRQHQRPGLLFLNGIVYIAWASHGDNGPYHGWVIGYDAHTLQQTAVFNTSPAGGLDGIWQSGGAPSADAEGNIYVATGNGGYDSDRGTFGDSVLKISTRNGLTLSDYFTPFNYVDLNNRDADLGSGGILLLPDLPGNSGHRPLMLTGGKEGAMYLIDRDHLGKLNSGSDRVVQTLRGAGGLYSTPAYFNGAVYYAQTNDPLRRYPIVKNHLADKFTESQEHFGGFGTNPVISANGNTDGIVWVIEMGAPGVLRAYLASDVSQELYNSRTDRDDLGESVKFTLPTVANGRVYVGAAHSLVVYGLLKKATAPPGAPTRLAATRLSDTSIALSWANSGNDATGIRIERAASGGPFLGLTTVDPRASTFVDSNLPGQTAFQYRIKAVNPAGASTATPPVGARTLVAERIAGLVGYWKLDEGVGDLALDSSPTGLLGKVEGEVTRVAGRIGTGALSFHAVGNAISHVAIPDHPALRFTESQRFTAAAWVNPEIQNGRNSLFLAKSHDNGPWYGLGVTADNRWRAAGSNGDIAGGLVTAGWHHIALTQDAKTHQRRLYVDGVIVNFGNAAPGDGKGDLWLGSAKNTQEGFAGAVDDVRIYNIALSEAAVRALADRH